MSEMPWGKYKRWELEDIPSDYFEWLLDETWFLDAWEGLADEIQHEMDVRSRSNAHFYGEMDE